ncbi:oxidoreductase [Klebsiella michiganensis]|uniref:Oxidoreductase n=1 Tax=Klebsiella michiganensis TaxID=1134687 RepID=A0A7H4PKP8_9ENTR|nr:oxidoreductase [Klebsiella michiganensis]
MKNIIPQFRIPGELIQHDIDFVVAHGVKIEYGCDPHLSVEKLQAKGFRYVLVGTGTDKNSGVKLGGDNQNVHKSLQFLREFNRGAGAEPGQTRGRGRRRQHRHGLRPRGAARARRAERDHRLSPLAARDARLARRVR